MIKLRTILETDLDRITELCQDKEIHDMTLNVPYPYSRKDAEFFYTQVITREGNHSFAIELEGENQLIGLIGIHLNKDKPWMAEIGYWMGKKYRNRGYTTEGLRQIIEYSFAHFPLQRIYATHDPINPASGRVMQKAGMSYEGVLKSIHYKDGIYKDSVYYGIIRPN